jgi:leucyl/phenylalanyl-tRNA---protein transferase
MTGLHHGSQPLLHRQALVRSQRPPAADATEPLLERAHRIALATAWALKPVRLADVLPTLGVLARHYLGRDGSGLPDPRSALARPDGLAGICDVLTPELVLEAYRNGLFPWSQMGPQKWWAIGLRSTLFFENYRLEKSVRRCLRQQKFRVTFDEDFLGVMRGCAEPRGSRLHVTWIRPDIMRVFTALHALGHAHSVEVWDEAGEMVGGAYGLAIGRVFFTESQFFRARDASKTGFAVLNMHLQHWGFAINDAKAHTVHLGNLGFTEIPRDRHNAIVARFGSAAAPGSRWRTDPSLDAASWEPSQAQVLRRDDVIGTTASEGSCA